MTTLLDVLQTKPARDRSPKRCGLSARFAEDAGDGDEPLAAVDPNGGSRNAGIIRGASLIAVGEALGHDAYIDEETVRQTVELGNSKDGGVKVRFTHPSMSGDGLGSYLGRARNFEVSEDGQQAIGDVHFSPTSRETPDGDRGGYVMELAKDDPDAFGMSIVFDHDLAAESNFVAENSEADDDGRQVFESPAGESNPANFYHVRLSALHGADFVDEPAANPDGLFHAKPTHSILSQAESVLEYALGISETVPEETGGLSAERIKGFLSRFCEARGIAFSIERGDPMTKPKSELSEDSGVETPEASATETPKTKPAETPADTPTETAEASSGDSKAELRKYVDKFGAEKGTEYFLAGTSFDEALSKEFDALKQAKTLGAGDDRGEETAVGEFAADAGDDELPGDSRLSPGIRGLASQIRMSVGSRN